MTEDINPLQAADFIRDSAVKIAKAKSERAYLEEFRKCKKALLMIQAGTDGVSSLGAQEAYAYAHPEYQSLLEAIKTAIESEERLRWLMVAAQTKIEIWRSFESSRRAEMAL